MRELTVDELSAISGGLELGTGTGGIFSAGNIAAASRLLAGAGALYAAWQFGTRIGRGIYNSGAFDGLATP
jgi:hypothetical protein